MEEGGVEKRWADGNSTAGDRKRAKYGKFSNGYSKVTIIIIITIMDGEMKAIINGQP